MEKKKQSYDYLANAASPTDCTGLMPTLADTEEKRESYNDIFHIYTTPKHSKDE